MEQQAEVCATQPPRSWSVEVVELVVFDISSWHARCTHCGWRGRARTTEAKAIADAKAHGKQHAEAE